MDIIRILLGTSTLLCALVAGLVLTFAIIVMPGIKSLNNHDYLQSFKVMDGIIQNNQPVFILVWLGSALTLIAATVLSIWQLQGLERILLLSACVLYVGGVQIPTVIFNIPINNELQATDLATANETELKPLRDRFESTWIQWNTIRTFVGIVTVAILIVVLLGL